MSHVAGLTEAPNVPASSHISEGGIVYADWTGAYPVKLSVCVGLYSTCAALGLKSPRQNASVRPGLNPQLAETKQAPWLPKTTVVPAPITTEIAILISPYIIN
jgi:hypothetical protein